MLIVKKMVAMFAGFLTVLPVNPAISQPLAKLASVATMNGKCQKLIISGTDFTSLCENTVVNAAYKGGKSSFQFVAGDKAIIGFFGSDSKAIGNKASLRVEKISLNLLMGTPSTMGAATGSCSYTNPYAGPSVVQCSAVSEGKAFEAAFVSDGREPSLKEF